MDKLRSQKGQHCCTLEYRHIKRGWKGEVLLQKMSFTSVLGCPYILLALLGSKSQLNKLTDA